VILRRIEHATMIRSVHDITYRHKITLKQALCSAPISFETLDGEIIKFTSDEVIGPHSQKCFPGKGMPIYNDDPLSPLMNRQNRGNFILKF
jgi:DnaJ-class molecular chaperone